MPVSATQSGELKVTGIDGPGDATTLTLDPAQRFGSLQTAVDGDRTLLVATSNGDPAQLDALLAWLDSEPMRWSRLSGTAVLAPARRCPRDVRRGRTQEQVMTVDNGNAQSAPGGLEWASLRWSPSALGCLVAQPVEDAERLT